MYDGQYDSKFALSPSISVSSNRKNDSSNPPRDILVVSREPLVHAVLFRNKSRVVIQDFFMATPRHPFFLWLLEDRLNVFNGSSTAGTFPKGPFSYSIEKDIDRYLEHKRAVDDSQKIGPGRKKRKASHSAPMMSVEQPIDAAATQPDKRARTLRGRKVSPRSRRPPVQSAAEDVIIELQEDIMHPLVDATNPRLYSECTARPDLELQRTEDGLLSRGSTCRLVDQRLFFRPSNETVLVHMWTHVFLGG